MTRRLDRFRRRGGSRERAMLPYSMDQWAHDLAQNPPIHQTWSRHSNTESIDHTFASYVHGAYKSNGIVFAVTLARMLLFTEARFQFQRLDHGRPGDLFGTQDLGLLETPWPNGTTGDLLAHLEQDATLAGNGLVVRRQFPGRPDRLARLRPDWTNIVLGSTDPLLAQLSGPAKEKALASINWNDVDVEVAGYLFQPPGGDPKLFRAEDVAHFTPIPDPTAQFRGMSWLTPVIEEIRADTAATRHKGKFFDNAATPNLAISPKDPLSATEFRELMELLDEDHRGVENAYRNLWLTRAADVTVIGADMKQLDFKITQGAGETRLCAAGGVPPIIVGLSEGLDAATYSNYGMARRKFGDHWARPQWREAAGALATIVPAPSGTRLWYDDRDIPFLQEDRKDDAEIAQAEATTIKTLVDAGYEPDSVVAAVLAGDLSKLEHSGLYSVQLMAAGAAKNDDPEGANP